MAFRRSSVTRALRAQIRTKPVTASPQGSEAGQIPYTVKDKPRLIEAITGVTELMCCWRPSTNAV
jgi:hypothetical protein